jgi:hypothetical protein
MNTVCCRVGTGGRHTFKKTAVSYKCYKSLKSVLADEYVVFDLHLSSFSPITISQYVYQHILQVYIYLHTETLFYLTTQTIFHNVWQCSVHGHSSLL